MDLKTYLEEERVRLSAILLSMTFYDNIEGSTLQDQLRQHAAIRGELDGVNKLYQMVSPPQDETTTTSAS